MIISSLDQDDLEPQNFILEIISNHLIDYTDSLLLKTQQLVPQEERILSEIFRGILRLRELALRDKLNQYRFQLEDEQESEMDISNELMQEINQVNQQLLKINKAMDNRTIFSSSLESGQ